jgi:hypothetical protein
MVVILISCTVFVLGTVPELESIPAVVDAFYVVEVLCVALFTLEYLTRLVVTPGKIKFIFDFMNIIDVLSIAPFFVEEISMALAKAEPGWVPTPVGEEDAGGSALKILRLFRVLRVVKIGRYLEGLQMFGRAFAVSIAPISMALFVIAIMIILFASLIYFAEIGMYDEKLQLFVDTEGLPTQFESIPDVFYFVVITMTTVGYGDKAPVTTVGQIFTIMTAIIGIFFIAFPVSIFR